MLGLRQIGRDIDHLNLVDCRHFVAKLFDLIRLTKALESNMRPRPGQFQSNQGLAIHPALFRRLRP